MTIQEFTKKRPYLFWYVKDLSELSENAVVEGVLNYGTWEDVQELISILGLNKTAGIFSRRSSLKRNNFRPEIKHYFRLYFEKYA